MNTNDPNAVQWITLAVAIVAVAALFLVVPGQVNRAVSEIPMPAVPTAADIASAVDVPTAAEVAALIVVPQAPIAITPEVQEVSNSRVDRLCELTDGCEYWESKAPSIWKNKVMDEEEDIEDEILELLNLDEDDLASDYSFGDYDIFEIEVKEYQVRDYSVDFEAGDGNWEVKIFARITFQDIDESYEDHEYIVITSVLDEGEYDELSVEDVSRSFEFE